MNTPTIITQLEGLKHDSGKPDFSLISSLALTYLAKVLTFGASKYSAHNWRKGIPFSKILAACDRHLQAIKIGEDYDYETGLPHAAHLMCECMFLVELLHSNLNVECDDRYHYTEAQKNLLVSLLANKAIETK